MPEEITAVREIQVDRESIVRIHQLIRPYIRRTPLVEVDGADFGLDAVSIILKLELLQHTGSLLNRGARLPTC
jgi:threonine dehydratase